MKDTFFDFWIAWPDNGKARFSEYTRKKNRKGCSDKWIKEGLDSVGAVIVRNVEQRSRYDKGWMKDRGKYMSAPLVYLNQRQWEDGDFADLRDERKSSGPADGPVPDDVRRGIIGCILNGYSEEDILKNFNVSPTEFWDLRRKVGVVEGGGKLVAVDSEPF